MTDPEKIDGWEQHRRQQIRDLLKTTPAQRLAALEELIAVVRAAGARTREQLLEERDRRRSSPTSG